MALDVTVKPAALNPCCSVWKEKYVKLEERRKCLRQAVNLLTDQTDKIQAENGSLKKACEDERVRAVTEKELKEKELAARISLDNEISALKSEILSLQQKGNVADLEGKEQELAALQDRICKGEREINHVKELLEKEKLRADSEKKIAEVEKKNAADAWNQVKVEKAKADDERKLAHVQRKKAEEYRLQLEALKKEVEEEKSKSVSTDLNIEETLSGKLKAGKNRVNGEKKNGEYEISNAEEQCKFAEGNEKLFIEERRFEENISRQLKAAKGKNFELLKGEQYVLQLQELKQEAEATKSKLVSETLKLEEAKRKLKVEKSNVIKERKRADSELVKAEEQRKDAEACEKKFVEERSRANQFYQLLEAAENRIKELEKEVEQLKSKGADVERQKVMVEKMHADSQMLRAEEQRKLADINKKMAEEERSRAEQLSHQLTEDRLMIGDLQKQIQKLLSRKIIENSAILPDKTINARTTDVKLLKKQLKLEKQRLKHAKEVAEFEKSRNSILQQEFHHLKLDFLRISCRLDVLDKCFSSSHEGTESMKKVGGFADLQWSKLNNIYEIEPCRLDLKSDSELLKSSCTGFTASDPLRQALGNTAPLFPVSGGNSAESMSGIDSKLESLLGGSDQKLLHSSAINSSSASFSDGQLVRSQEMGAFVTTAKNLVEEENFNARVPTISGEITEMIHNGNHTMMPKNSVESRHKVDAVGIVNGHGIKRRRETDSIEFLRSKNKRFHLKMDDKQSDLHGVLCGPLDQLLDKPEYVDSTVQGNILSKPEKIVKKRKINREEVVLRQHLTGINEVTKAKNVENAFLEGVDASKFASLSTNCLIPETSLDCREDSLGIDLGDMESFEEVANGNYMKLLNLEDATDEESYRRALEMPLSPSLPEVVDLSAETFNMDMDKLEPLFGMPAAKVSDSRSVDSRLEVELPNMPKIQDDSLDLGVDSELRSVQENVPAYIVISSSISDTGSVTRVFSATRSCMARCSFGAHAESTVREIFHALKMEKELSRREKACTLLTLLLLNFSACTWGNYGTFLNEDFVSCLDSFCRDINSVVVSDIEARSSFAEECCVDELLSLVEELLMGGRVVVHTDTSSNPMLEHDSVINIFLDGKSIGLPLRSTAVELLMAGSIILGSICTTIDHLGFLCEASYNILRVSRFDTATALNILHIFAYIGGEKFLSLEDYSLTMTVLKAVVMFLEERSSSAASASYCLPCRNAVMSVFHPCAKCLFSRDAVPIASVTSMLLEKLQSFAMTGQMESANLSNFFVLGQKDKSNQSLGDEEVHSDVRICHDALCSINKCTLPATGPSFVIADLSDLLSLLELLACYLSWEWTGGKIIPLLLEMLDRETSENLVIAVVILLGHIGKIGVASCGYQDRGVDLLMHKLCGYISGETGVKLAFPVQIAAVSALVGILSLDFEQVMSVGLEIGRDESQYAFSVVCIRNWYYFLGKELQGLSCSLLQPGGVVRN